MNDTTTPEKYNNLDEGEDENVWVGYYLKWSSGVNEGKSQRIIKSSIDRITLTPIETIPFIEKLSRFVLVFWNKIKGVIVKKWERMI